MHNILIYLEPLFIKCMNFKSKYLWRTVIIFILFTLSNFSGFIFVFGKNEGDFSLVSDTNPFLDQGELDIELPYWFWNYIDINSQDNKTLLRLHYLFGLNNPEAGESVEIKLYFAIQPVIYDFLVNQEDYFDYVETTLFEITASSGNETLTYNTRLNAAKYALTAEEKTFDQSVDIPINWNSSEKQYLSLRFGEFTIIQGSKRFNAVRLNGETQLFVLFTKELDFDLVESHTDGTIRRGYYTEFSLTLDIELFYKILFTCLIGLGSIVLGYIFSSEWFSKRHTDLDADISFMQSNANNENQIDEDILKKFAKRCRLRYTFYSIASIFFIFAVLMFLISSIWFGAPTGKYYTVFIVGITIFCFLVYLFFVGMVNQKRREIQEVTLNNETIAKKVGRIHKNYEISFKEITTTLAVLISLFLFIIGSSAVQKIWF